MYCGLDVKCPPQSHVLNTWSPASITILEHSRNLSRWNPDEGGRSLGQGWVFGYLVPGLSVYLSSIYLSIYLSIYHLSTNLSSVYQSIIYLLSINLSINLLSINLSIYHLSIIYQSVIYQFIYLSIYLCVSLYLWSPHTPGG
jgi:hypothetical protein